LYTEYESVFF